MSKLVRDKVPAIIERSGHKAIIHTAKKLEYKIKLYEKLQEEVSEYLQDENPSELADIIEVLYAIFQLKSLTPEQIENIRKTKYNERGGFTKKLILDN